MEAYLITNIILGFLMKYNEYTTKEPKDLF